MQSNRQREIKDLGGKEPEEKTDSETVQEAFDTYRQRGEEPPILKDIKEKLNKLENSSLKQD